MLKRKQLDFSLEVDKTKDIFRQTYISSGERKENDAEHAWHMALMAYLLREHANEEVDILKVIIMILIHDLVEIDAGDTYAYDEKSKTTQVDREKRAADKHSDAGCATIHPKFVGGCSVDCKTLAHNDGLSEVDWRNWFERYDLTEPLAVIHFTKFRYRYEQPIK